MISTGHATWFGALTVGERGFNLIFFRMENVVTIVDVRFSVSASTRKVQEPVMGG